MISIFPQTVQFSKLKALTGIPILPKYILNKYNFYKVSRHFTQNLIWTTRKVVSKRINGYEFNIPDRYY